MIKINRRIAWLFIFLLGGIAVNIAYPGIVNAVTLQESMGKVKTTQCYSLQPEETAWSVANDYGMTVHELQVLNKHRLFPKGFDKITTGDAIDVPLRSEGKNTQLAAKCVTSPSSENDNENALASHLSRAANLLSAADFDAQKSQVLGMASSATSDSAQEWLNQFGTARIQLNLDKDFNVDGSSADILVPLYDNKTSMLFTQLGFRNQDERNTLNVGTGVRYFQGGWMYGGNIFFDNDLTGNNRRVGLGAEAWTDYLKLSGNYYFGLTDWHQSRNLADYNERPANGYDLRAEGYLPAYPQFGGKLMYEKYFGDEVALFSYSNRKKNPYAVTSGVYYTPFPLLTIGGEHRAGSNSTNDSRMNLQFTIRPGGSWSEHFNADAVSAARTLAGSRTDLVERNNTIVLDYQKQELITLSLPAKMTGAALDVLSLQAQVKSKYGLQRIEWQSPQLISEGGKLNTGTVDRLDITLPSYSSTVPYILSGVAYDRKGNVSERAVTEITVTAASISSVLSTKTVEPSTLPADGKSTSIVTLTLRNGDNQPVTGVADQLTSSAVAVPYPTALEAHVSQTIQESTKTLQDIEPTVGQYIESAPGVYEATLTAGTLPGEAMITTYKGGAELKSAAVRFVDANSATIKVGNLTVENDGAVANGTATNSVKAVVTDVDGKLLAGLHVNFLADNGAVIGATGITNAQGEVVQILTNVKAGISQVRAEINNISQTVDVNFIPGAGIPGAGVVSNDNAPANDIDAITITVPVADANGNLPPAGTVVDITITRPDGSSSTQPGTVDAQGNVVVGVTSPDAGTVTVVVDTGNGSTSTDVTFVPDVATATIAAGNLSVVSDGATANGAATNSVKAVVTDASGKLLAGLQVNFLADNGAVIGATGITNAQGEVVQTLTNVKAGISVVTASINGHSESVDTTFIADVGTATIASGNLLVQGDYAVANGTDTNRVGVTVTDANGNPLSNQVVTLSAGNGAVIAGIVTTGADGKAAATLSSNSVGVSVVTASISGSSQSVNTTFIADEGTATIISGDLVIVDNGAVADGTATNSVAMTVTDAYGHPLAGKVVSLTANNGAVIASNVTTDDGGKATATLTSMVAGISTIRAYINSTYQTVNVMFVADVSTATILSSSLIVRADNALADGTDVDIISIKVTDAQGNPIANQPVTLSADNGASIIPSVMTMANGKATVTVKSTTVGVSTVSTSINNTTQSVAVNFVADSGTATILGGDLIVTKDNAIADGADMNTIEVTVTDNGGHPVPGVNVYFQADNGAFIFREMLTDADGKAKMKVTSKVAGVSKVRASINGSHQTVDVTFVADNTTITLNRLAALNDNAVADGTDTNSVEVTVTDANGNPLNNQHVTLIANNGAVITDSVTTDAEGKAEATLTNTKAGISTVTAGIPGSSQSVNVLFTAGTLSAVTSTFTVEPAIITANGVDSSTLIFTALDIQSNGLEGIKDKLNFIVTDAAGQTPAASQILVGAITEVDNTYQAQLTGTLVGTYTITPFYNGRPLAALSEEVQLKVDLSTAAITITVSDNLQRANGVAYSVLTATLKDAFQNPVIGQTITFSGGEEIGFTIPATTDHNGNTRVNATSLSAGDKTITAAFGNSTQTETVTYVPNPLYVGNTGINVSGNNIWVHTSGAHGHVYAVRVSDNKVVAATYGATTYLKIALSKITEPVHILVSDSEGHFTFVIYNFIPGSKVYSDGLTYGNIMRDTTKGGVINAVNAPSKILVINDKPVADCSGTQFKCY